MSLTPGKVWRGAPSIGQDTTDILSKMIGLPDREVKALFAEKVVHQTEPYTKSQVEAVNP